MKNLQITKRDVKIFFLGMLFGFLVVLISDLDDAAAEFKEGYESVTNRNGK
jgi:hypothetical protein